MRAARSLAPMLVTVVALVIALVVGPTPVLAHAEAVLPITVTEQPADVTILVGGEASFTSRAQDAGHADVPVLRWQARAAGSDAWADVPGSAGVNPLVYSEVDQQQDGTAVRAVFLDAPDLVVSDPATLSVLAPVAPVVTLQPVSVTVTPGSPFSLVVAGSGRPSPSVQWQQANDGGGPWFDLTGETSGTLHGVAPPAPLNRSWYRAVLTNSAGSAVSDPATVSTSQLPPRAVPSVTASNSAARTLSVHWTAPPVVGAGAVAEYRVTIRRSGDPIAVRVLSPPTAATTFTALDPGTYTASVTAANDAGVSDETRSAPVAVAALAVTGFVSGSMLRPFVDGYQDSVTFTAGSNFAVAGEIQLRTASGSLARRWPLASRTAWSVVFTGKTAAGTPLPYGSYVVKFVIGGTVAASSPLTISRTEAALRSATWSVSTLYPAKDGYRDTATLSLRTTMPATMSVKIMKDGSSTVLRTVSIARGTSGSFVWNGRTSAGTPVSAGRYVTRIVVKGGDGTARAVLRYVNVSGKKVTPVKFVGTISATSAYLETISGTPRKRDTGRVEFWSSPTRSDAALMGARLPPSFGGRYSAMSLYACIDGNYTDNPATVAFADQDGEPSSRGVGVPDSGCAGAGFPTSYIAGGQVFWFARNLSRSSTWGAVDYIKLSLTRYVLK
jgi:hypothetical protein